MRSKSGRSVATMRSFNDCVAGTSKLIWSRVLATPLSFAMLFLQPLDCNWRRWILPTVELLSIGGSIGQLLEDRLPARTFTCSWHGFSSEKWWAGERGNRRGFECFEADLNYRCGWQ